MPSDIISVILQHADTILILSWSTISTFQSPLLTVRTTSSTISAIINHTSTTNLIKYLKHMSTLFYWHTRQWCSFATHHYLRLVLLRFYRLEPKREVFGQNRPKPIPRFLDQKLCFLQRNAQRCNSYGNSVRPSVRHTLVLYCTLSVWQTHDGMMGQMTGHFMTVNDVTRTSVCPITRCLCNRFLCNVRATGYIRRLIIKPVTMTGWEVSGLNNGTDRTVCYATAYR